MTTDRSFGIVIDLRCLQDPGYATRGVGRHALALLRHAPADVRLIGLVDPTLPPLLPEAEAAVDEIHGNAYAASRAAAPAAAAPAAAAPAAFVMLSPMTHDPIFVARLLSDTSLLRAAVVYDFIPYRWPDRYLPGPTERLAYAITLRWLARCNFFAPISQSSADDLMTLTGARPGAIAVTGAPLDPMFEKTPSGLPRHLLVVGGGDPRKNPEMVIRAHARIVACYRRVAGFLWSLPATTPRWKPPRSALSRQPSAAGRTSSRFLATSPTPRCWTSMAAPSPSSTPRATRGSRSR